MTKAEAKEIALRLCPVESYFSGEFLTMGCVPAVSGFKFKFEGDVYEIVHVDTNVNVIRTLKRRGPSIDFPELTDRLWRLAKKGAMKGRHDAR